MQNQSKLYLFREPTAKELNDLRWQHGGEFLDRALHLARCNNLSLKLTIRILINQEK